MGRVSFGVLFEMVVFMSVEVALEKDWQVVFLEVFLEGRKVILGHNLISEVVGFSDQVT